MNSLIPMNPLYYAIKMPKIKLFSAQNTIGAQQLELLYHLLLFMGYKTRKLVDLCLLSLHISLEVRRVVHKLLWICCRRLCKLHPGRKLSNTIGFGHFLYIQHDIRAEFLCGLTVLELTYQVAVLPDTPGNIFKRVIGNLVLVQILISHNTITGKENLYRIGV